MNKVKADKILATMEVEESKLLRLGGSQVRERLRDLDIMTDSGPRSQTDYSCEGYANVRVIFDGQKEALLEYINKYKQVVGCVAWLTDDDILKALATKEFVSIIVQKEDFLRPDIKGSKSQLRELYDSLPSVERCLVAGASHLSMAGDSTLEAIRCVGNHNYDKKPAFPRMHHKFLVFTDNLAQDDLFPLWSPSKEDCVWTGSYNLSHTAVRSFENVVVLQSSKIVEAYVNEWEQIVALSEPLDWKYTWATPEWHIGP